MDSPREGVFKIDKSKSDLRRYAREDFHRYLEEYGIKQYEFDELNKVRKRLFLLGLIGVDRENIGYGNVSMRVRDGFMITGTQTSYLADLDFFHYPVVFDCNPHNNTISAVCPDTDPKLYHVIKDDILLPSSECMTHYGVYKIDPSINAVIHVHSPRLWVVRHELSIPTTSSGVEYGTPEMFDEVEKLWNTTDLRGRRIFAMDTHQDGVVVFGQDIASSMDVLMEYYHDKVPKALKNFNGIPGSYKHVINDPAILRRA